MSVFKGSRRFPMEYWMSEAGGENRIIVRLLPDGRPGDPLAYDFTGQILLLPWSSVTKLKDNDLGTFIWVANHLPRPLGKNSWKVEIEDELRAYLLMNFFDLSDSSPATAHEWDVYRTAAMVQLRRAVA